MNSSAGVLQLLGLLLAAVVLHGVLSCSGTRGRGGDVCYDSADCTTTDGSLEACINGYCEEVGCLSSGDCTLGNICSVESLDYECVTGCLGDSDCAAGSTCVDSTCEDYGCRSSLLDCNFGEICNDQGQCEEAEGAHCNSCELSGNEWDDGGTGTTCDDVIIGNDTCGGSGSFCINWYSGLPVCYVGCEEQADCPGGYLCQLMTRPLPVGCPDSYLVLGTACLADCAEE